MAHRTCLRQSASSPGSIRSEYRVRTRGHARRSGPVIAVVLQFLMGFAYKAYSRRSAPQAYQAGLTAIAVTLTALYLSRPRCSSGFHVNVFVR